MAYHLPATGFVRLPTVLAVIPVSKSTWWAGVREGRFPRPVKITPRCTAWRVEDIYALIERIRLKNSWQDLGLTDNLP